MWEYIALCMKEQSSIPERKLMLAEKKKQLEKELKRIQDSMDYIDWKQAFYDDVLSGKTEYYSNLTNENQ